MLSALTGAFLAANPDRPLLAAAAAAETMSVCAEIAQRRLRTGEGNASFRTRLIDAMCNLTPETFRKWRQEA
jgi:hydroxyethylthiazole kinase